MIVTARYKAGIKVRIHCHALLQIEVFNEKDAREFILKYFRSRVRRAVIGRPFTHVTSWVLADPYTQARVGCRGGNFPVLLGSCGTGIKTDMDAGFLAVNSISNYEKIKALNVQGLADTSARDQRVL